MTNIKILDNGFTKHAHILVGFRQQIKNFT